MRADKIRETVFQVLAIHTAQHGPATPHDIAADMGLGHQQVSKYLRALTDEGHVLALRAQHASGGRPTMLYRPAMSDDT